MRTSRRSRCTGRCGAADRRGGAAARAGAGGDHAGVVDAGEAVGAGALRLIDARLGAVGRVEAAERGVLAFTTRGERERDQRGERNPGGTAATSEEGEGEKGEAERGGVRHGGPIGGLTRRLREADRPDPHPPRSRRAA